MGLGSGQQHFGKSNKIVLILMPDYLFTSQFESILFLANQMTGYLLRVREKKDPRPRIPKGRSLSHSVHGKLYCVPRHWESCMWTSQQTWPGNQPTHIFMAQDWSLEIVTSCLTSRNALRLIVRLPARFNNSVWFFNMFKNLPATDFDREIVRDRTMFLRSHAIASLDNNKMIRMSFKAYAQLPGIFDWSARRLNMLKNRRSPPHNRICSCDCSRSLRLAVRLSKIACDYRARLVLYRSQNGRKRS